MPNAQTEALRWFTARRITIARRRANVTYLPTFAAQNRAEMVRLSETGKVHGPAPRPITPEDRFNRSQGAYDLLQPATSVEIYPAASTWDFAARMDTGRQHGPRIPTGQDIMNAPDYLGPFNYSPNIPGHYSADADVKSISPRSRFYSPEDA
jgi:hypothetical protein